jgi:hypothetical protein
MGEPAAVSLTAARSIGRADARVRYLAGGKSIVAASQRADQKGT